MFALKHCEVITNECPYNYLRGFYSEEIESIIKQNLVHIMNKFGISRQILQFLAFVYDKEKKSEIQEIIFRLLEAIDNRRKTWWNWKTRSLNGNCILRTLEDRKICKILYKHVDMTNSIHYYYAITKSQNI